MGVLVESSMAQSRMMLLTCKEAAGVCLYESVLWGLGCCVCRPLALAHLVAAVVDVSPEAAS
jgi:hypothetical protein